MVGSTAGKVLCLAYSDSGCPGVSPELDPLTTVVNPTFPPKTSKQLVEQDLRAVYLTPASL